MTAYQMLWYQLNFAERKKLIWQNHKTTSKFPSLFQYWNLFNGRAHIIEQLGEICMDLITRPAPDLETFYQAMLDKFPKARELRNRGFNQVFNHYNWGYKAQDNKQHTDFTTLYALYECPTTLATMLSGSFFAKILQEIDMFNSTHPEFALNIDLKEILTDPIFLWYGYIGILRATGRKELAKDWLNYANICTNEEDPKKALNCAIEYGASLVQKEKEQQEAHATIEAARKRQEQETLALLKNQANPALNQLKEIFSKCPSTLREDFLCSLKGSIAGFGYK